MTFTPAHKPGGTPDGGQFTAPAHSDDVPSLTPRATDPLDALGAARLRISAQRQYLKDQELALRSATSRIAGASAAAKFLERYPTATTAQYRRTQFGSTTFLALYDHDGNVLMDEDRISGSGRYDPSVQDDRFAIYGAMQHLDDAEITALPAQGVTILEDGREVLDLQVAIDSVPAGLDVDPDPYTDPLSAHTRKLLVDAAREGRAKMGARLFIHEGTLNPADEEELRYQVDALDRIFGSC